MIELKPIPSGVDISIQKLQSDIYTRLSKAWPADIVWESYGRVYRNREGNEYTAERFMPEATDGRDYADVYWKDSVDVVSFFGVSTTTSRKTRHQADVHMIVFCNLRTLKPGLSTSRADEEVRIDFLRLIGKCLYGFHYKGVETGITNVLKEYRVGQFKLNSVDMSPVHAFRLNFSLTYNPLQSNIVTI